MTIKIIQKTELSNFWKENIVIGCCNKGKGITFNSSEHLFQALKTKEGSALLSFSEDAKTPFLSKRLGRKVDIKANWDVVRVATMEIVLIIKFSDSKLRRRLQDTKSESIEEGNSWNDTFWGVSLKTSKGSNNLGKLLVKVRDRNIKPVDKNSFVDGAFLAALVLGKNKGKNPKSVESLHQTIEKQRKKYNLKVSKESICCCIALLCALSYDGEDKEELFVFITNLVYLAQNNYTLCIEQKDYTNVLRKDFDRIRRLVIFYTKSNYM